MYCKDKNIVIAESGNECCSHLEGMDDCEFKKCCIGCKEEHCNSRCSKASEIDKRIIEVKNKKIAK
jgi:hypothetical protein